MGTLWVEHLVCVSQASAGTIVSVPEIMVVELEPKCFASASSARAV
jgi:hypothetical protein